MYTVRDSAGKKIATFKTKAAAERYIRQQGARTYETKKRTRHGLPISDLGIRLQNGVTWRSRHYNLEVRTVGQGLWEVTTKGPNGVAVLHKCPTEKACIAFANTLENRMDAGDKSVDRLILKAGGWS